MTNPLTTVPPDYARLRRADEPSLRSPLPAFSTPVESANVLLNKQIVTLNRAGSNPGNPILSGLGVTLQYSLSRLERLVALYVYQEPGAIGQSQLGAASLNDLLLTYNFRAGSGLTKAGSPATGALKNFIRTVNSDGRGVEKEYWIKSYDADVVTLEGQAALSQDTLDPVAVVLAQVDAGRAWLDVRVDFMPSWNDEFQVLHVATVADAEAGFRKSYGGAAFVSFFDTTPGTEGVGTDVNPITQAFIYDTRKIQVNNAVGIYHITARFRSRKDATFFVDVPLIIQVIAGTSCECATPATEPCGQMLLKRLTPLPAHSQSAASVPGVQDVAGTLASPIDRDLFYISVHGAIVGTEADLMVRKWQILPDSTTLAGFKLQQYGTDLVFKPLRTATTSPTPGGDYGSPLMLTVCFDVQADRALGITFYTAQIVDGEELGPAMMFSGPKARDIATTPAGGTGGIDDCITYG